MARLNSRQRRAHKVRVALNMLAVTANAPIVALSGDLRSSQASFEGGNHKVPHGQYKVSAVRPTIVTGKRKSGKAQVVKDITLSDRQIADKLSAHESRHDEGMKPAALIVRKGSPKLRLVAPVPVITLTLEEREKRAPKMLTRRVHRPR